MSQKSETPNIDFLREEVNKLKYLLDNPQPGLMSWCKLYGERMQSISDFWNTEPGEDIKRKQKYS